MRGATTFGLQRLGALAGLLGVLSLSGWAGEGEPPEPAPTTESPTSSSSPTASDGPLGEPTLDGPSITGKTAELQVPEGYRVEEFGFGIWHADRGASRITLLEVPALGDVTLRQLVSTGGSNFAGDPRVAYGAELGGARAYVATRKERSGQDRRECGAVLAGDAARVMFSFAPSTSPAEQDALVESVLATFRWR